MLRSLYTAVAGLDAHQEMLDVTSNNIANVNTNGFKSNATTFESTLSQTLQAATTSTDNGGPATVIGGENPNQIGLGVQLAGTQANFAQGSTESTGRNEDIMINGDGFLVTSTDGALSYTRAGSLHLSTDATAGGADVTNLVEPDGSLIQGYTSTSNGATPPVYTQPTTAQMQATPTNLQLAHLTDGTYASWSIQPNGSIIGVKSGGQSDVLGVIAMASFSNPEGLSASGNTSYIQTIASGAAKYNQPSAGQNGSLQSGALEMSNVNLATEFTNLIISERGFQANSRVITTSDQILQTLVQMGA
jgi:flagellar hook protein FlgE